MLNLSSLTGKQERTEWGDHPYTRYLLLKTKTELLQRSLDVLLGVCTVSTDPKVTAKLAEYKALVELIDFLEKSGRDTNE